MSLRLPSPKVLALSLVGLVAAYLLFAWLALPPILQSQAERFVAEKTGHRLSLERPEFNPFELRLRLANLRLAEPDGKPLLAFRELVVDVSSASLWRRAFVFDAIRLDGPEGTVVLRGDGRLNWSAFLDALKSKEEQPDSPLPRLDVDRFTLSGGRIDFRDERHGFASRIEPLDLELSDLSTLPDDKGRYTVAARTAFGARFQWQGDVSLNPIAASGHVEVDDLDLARLSPYLGPSVPVADPAGKLALATDYRASYAAGKPGLVLDKVSAKLAGLALALGKSGGPAINVDTVSATGGGFDLAAGRATLAALTVEGARASLPQPGGKPIAVPLGGLVVEKLEAALAGRNLAVERIALQGARVQGVRDRRGRVDLVSAVQAAMAMLPAGNPKAVEAPAAAPWHYRVGKFELTRYSLGFRDEAVAPAADIAVDDLAIAADGLSDDLTKSLPVRASFKLRSGGAFEAAGQVVPAAPAADVKFKLADAALGVAQPYLSEFARLTLSAGRLSSEGRASWGKTGPSVKAGFAVRDLRLVERDGGELFLAWKSLASRDVQASARRLDIGELTLEGLDTRLIIDKDKSVNLTRILNKPADPEATPPAVAAKPPGESFVANIERLKLVDGAMDFADQSLALPFGTRIHHLRGSVNGLSTRPGTPGQVELDGQVDDYGLARAVGQIDLLNATDFTDLKVIFRNVEMTRLTPYSATFAGRRIASGKLSLDLEYKIKQRQLAGDNQIVMEQLTLGERVESPEAKNLPLDLAIAILQDSDGRIDLGLPVSGSLDDPQFSYGGIVWKAILNVIGKIATAPFRALGALFGGGDKFESIAFEAGDARLTPPEREKLVRLAAALAKRPGLALTVHGVYAETDRMALQDRQLRRTLATKMGRPADEPGDPGPLSTATPKVQAALESLYADRIGSADLAALKEGYRKANPGQLEESATGKMLSRLSGLFRDKRTLNEQEVAQLKGADFHGLLYERLRQRETVDEAQLQALARRRSEALVTDLGAAGTPAERIVQAAPEKVDGKGRDVPLKLVLGAAKKGP